MKIEPGDLVLVRVKAFGPEHKIADRWEQAPYKVLSQLHNSPVFKVQPVDGEDENSIQVLHWNMLFLSKLSGLKQTRKRKLKLHQLCCWQRPIS